MINSKSETILLTYINETRAIQSLLYDCDLMPEQLKRETLDWDRMLYIADHWRAREKTETSSTTPVAVAPIQADSKSQYRRLTAQGADVEPNAAGQIQPGKEEDGVVNSLAHDSVPAAPATPRTDDLLLHSSRGLRHSSGDDCWSLSRQLERSLTTERQKHDATELRLEQTVANLVHEREARITVEKELKDTRHAIDDFAEMNRLTEEESDALMHKWSITTDESLTECVERNIDKWKQGYLKVEAELAALKAKHERLHRLSKTVDLRREEQIHASRDNYFASTENFINALDALRTALEKP